VARRRGAPPRGRGAGRGRAKEAEPAAPPQPPIWERIILSRNFRRVVGITFVAAAIAILVMLVGPGAVTAGAGKAAIFVVAQGESLTQTVTRAVASSIQSEGRRLWNETPTPRPTRLPTAMPLPTATPLPTPPPPRRELSTPVGATTIKPQTPAKPGVAAPVSELPVSDALASQREYFEILSNRDVRRALQYWAPTAAPEARSVLDSAADRQERYIVRNLTPRPAPLAGVLNVVVDLEITDGTGRVISTQHVYQWQITEGQWYITGRLQ